MLETWEAAPLRGATRKTHKYLLLHNYLEADATRWAIGQSERFFVFGADRRLPDQRLLQTKNLMLCLARGYRPQ